MLAIFEPAIAVFGHLESLADSRSRRGEGTGLFAGHRRVNFVLLLFATMLLGARHRCLDALYFVNTLGATLKGILVLYYLRLAATS